MRTLVKIIVVLAFIGFISSCSSKKATVSKEKQEQIDNDKQGFEKNVQ
jgi:hypothetical protein